MYTLASIFFQETGSGKEVLLSKLLDLYANYKTADARSGVALALQSCAYSLTKADATLALNFLLEEGVKDDDPDVRSKMIDAGKILVLRLVQSYHMPIEVRKNAQLH